MSKAEAAQRRLAAKRAKKAVFGGQVVKIDDEWSVARLDEYNWQIKRNGKLYPSPVRCYYFGSLLSAFKELSAIMLDWRAKNSIAEVQREQTRILALIDKAIQ